MLRFILITLVHLITDMTTFSFLQIILTGSSCALRRSRWQYTPIGLFTKTHEEEREAEETWHINRRRKETVLLMTTSGAAFHVNSARKLK